VACTDTASDRSIPVRVMTGLDGEQCSPARTGYVPNSQCHGSGLLPDGSAQSGWIQPNFPALAFIQL
jgi:hypothetical protein